MVKKIYNENYNEGDIVTWADLNEEQKNYVVENAYRFPLLNFIWEYFNESIMEWYHERVQELAKQYEEIGIDINTDKIYWQSNSQGPYPEWRFEDMIDTVYVNYDDGEVDINVSGRSTEPDIDYDLNPYTDNEGYWGYDYNLSLGDLTHSDYNVPDEVVNEVEQKTSSIAKFVEELWELINDVCQAYPDDDYIRNELDVYTDDDYMIISDTEAKPIKA